MLITLPDVVATPVIWVGGIVFGVGHAQDDWRWMAFGIVSAAFARIFKD